MDAFQQRKNRTEQRKYAKEVGAERAKEKAARKKDALAAIDQWRKHSKAKVNLSLIGLKEVLNKGNARVCSVHYRCCCTSALLDDCAGYLCARVLCIALVAVLCCATL
jgi:hypothetical protein